MTVPQRIRQFVPLILATTAIVAVTAAPADAQRRGPGGRGPVVRVPAGRTIVFVSPYVYNRWYDPWYQWGPYPYPYGYRSPMFDTLATSVRIQVTPREAEVYVNGYRAGTVDEFDGVFQRLRLRPGGHEITIFHENYETVRETVYLSPGAEKKLQFAMNRLRDGERAEPPPPPSAMPEADAETAVRPATRQPAPMAEAEQAPRPAAVRFGTLALRVQPADADLFIDGERWTTPAGQDRVNVELSEGRHRVEVRKDGHVTYAQDILIRRNATFTLNVILPRS